MNYIQFKVKVGRLAKAKKVGHLCPNNDTLYSLWEAKWTPERVVAEHCTVEAQRKRHGLDQEA